MVTLLHQFSSKMYSRVPSLVGLDLWHAINGEQEDKLLYSKTAKRTSFRDVANNRQAAPFKEPRLNNGNSKGLFSELLAGGNYHGIRRSDCNKNFNNFYQNDYATNTLSNDLVREVLNDNKSKNDSTSYYHKQNWLDWNFPNRSVSGNGPTREELKKRSENYSRNQTKIPTENPCSCECKKGSAASLNRTKYVDSVRKDLPSNKKNIPKLYKKDNCCRFCLKNGEVQVYYESHSLKDSAGNVVCPILSKYVCPCCGATGKNAHTIRHCPLNAQFASMLGNNYKVKRRNAAGRITTFRL